MTITRIPVRTVYDNSNNPVGLSEFQVGEVVAIAQGGTSANSVDNARANLNITNANIRSLFSVAGGGSYNNTTGVITIEANDLSPYAKSVDLTTANVIELTNLYYTIGRANSAIDNRVTKTFVDNLGIDAATLDGIDSSAFALDTDLTTANVAEVTNLYFTNARSRLSISASGSINYDNSTGVISFTQGNTDTITEGSTNLYFSNARAIGSLVGQSVSMGDATITGNLLVLGNVVEFSTETLTIEDKNIVLANGSPSASASNGAGITVDGAQANITYLNSNDSWSFNKTIEVNGEPVLTFNNTFALEANESVTIAYTDGATSESVFYAEQGLASISVINGGTPGAKLQLNLSNVVINNGQGSTPINLEVSGNIAATGTITSPFFYSESDITLKENIVPIDGALNKVLNLLGVSFKWKSNQAKSIGVIAQDVERVVPEIVSSSTSGSKTVSYDSLIPLLIEAIKEQQKQIEDLRNKIK